MIASKTLQICNDFRSQLCMPNGTSALDRVLNFQVQQFIYIYTTVLPLSCTDGGYFDHISGTALSSGTNYDFYGAIVIFLLHFRYTKCKSRN